MNRMELRVRLKTGLMLKGFTAKSAYSYAIAITDILPGPEIPAKKYTQDVKWMKAELDSLGEVIRDVAKEL